MPRAIYALSDARAFRARLDALHKPLVIGLSSTTGLPATPELLRAFGERYPDAVRPPAGRPRAGDVRRDRRRAVDDPRHRPRLARVLDVRRARHAAGSHRRDLHSLDELFEAARVGRALGLVPESVARSRAWPGLAFVRVADVEPSVAAIGCRPGEPRAPVRNFLALAS